MTNPNDPINSIPDLNDHPSSWYGLTKREYFAALRRPQEGESALTPRVAEIIMGSKAPEGFSMETILWWIEAEEKLAVLHADALIKALNQ